MRKENQYYNVSVIKIIQYIYKESAEITYMKALFIQ